MTTIEDLRQLRVGQFTVFDTVTAYVGILVLAPILSWLCAKLNLKVPIVSWLWWTMPISVVFHMVFSQSTPLMKILSKVDDWRFYVAIMVLIVMTYMGSRNISKVN